MTREFWTLGVAAPRRAGEAAMRAETAGWDGFAVVDSQNLSGDSYVALAMAARDTEKIKIGTGVTNPLTRHPAATASAIASIQRISDGRAVLGIGRGDSSLAHIGRAPAHVDAFEKYLEILQTYLRGDDVPFDELDYGAGLAPGIASLGLADSPQASRIAWLRDDDPKVPVEVAATGPKVIAVAARHADRVMLAVGADAKRIAWGIEAVGREREAAGLDPDGISIGAYLNIVVHPDAAAAHRLVRGGLSTFARFSVMHGDIAGPTDEIERQVLERIHDAYDMTQHTRADSDQAGLLSPEFVERFAVVGPASVCVERLESLLDLGLDKVMVIGPTLAAARDEALEAVERFTSEVLPKVRGGSVDPRS